MNKISISGIKKLRDLTGAGFLDCKEALENSGLDIDKAIEFLDEVIEMNPLDYKTYKIRGDSYDAKGDYSMAGYDYKDAIRFNPSTDDKDERI